MTKVVGKILYEPIFCLLVYRIEILNILFLELVHKADELAIRLIARPQTRL
jgi:hypothetical protein